MRRAWAPSLVFHSARHRSTLTHFPCNDPVQCSPNGQRKQRDVVKRLARVCGFHCGAGLTAGIPKAPQFLSDVKHCVGGGLYKQCGSRLMSPGHVHPCGRSSSLSTWAAGSNSLFVMLYTSHLPLPLCIFFPLWSSQVVTLLSVQGKYVYGCVYICIYTRL